MSGTANQLLHGFFRRLSLVRTFQNQSNSRLKTGWNGSGNGSVSISWSDKHTLVFTEKGNWKTDGQDNLGFSNTYRWTLKNNYISLAHLRRGPNQPVCLVDFIPDGNVLKATKPYICGKDKYFATLAMVANNLSLVWEVEGPKKNDHMEYLYITELS